MGLAEQLFAATYAGFTYLAQMQKQNLFPAQSEMYQLKTTKKLELDVGIPDQLHHWDVVSIAQMYVKWATIL